jgi:ATP-binding cassette subfamily F protein uup
LPGLIEQLESRRAELEAEMSAEGFFQQDHAVTQVIIEQLNRTQSELDSAYARWEELEE